jgi:hypothetical protein
MNHDSIKEAGGYSTLVHLTQNCLDKAIDEFPVCDQVTKLHEVPRLELAWVFRLETKPWFIARVFRLETKTWFIDYHDR